MNSHSPFFTVRGVVFSALFGALMVVMSFMQFHPGFSPVQFTLENMAVMLAGVFLGAKYGFFSIFSVVFLTALGLPLLHGEGGLTLLLKPTGGFIWMFPICAFLAGWVAQRIKGYGWKSAALMFLGVFLLGDLPVYITGIPWLAYKINGTIAEALALGCYPYLIPDAMKAAAATAIIMAVRRAFPALSLTGSDAASVVRLDDGAAGSEAKQR
jgi:biotin transport system substrate-specific component